MLFLWWLCWCPLYFVFLVSLIGLNWHFPPLFFFLFVPSIISLLQSLEKLLRVTVGKETAGAHCADQVETQHLCARHQWKVCVYVVKHKQIFFSTTRAQNNIHNTVFVCVMYMNTYNTTTKFGVGTCFWKKSHVHQGLFSWSKYSKISNIANIIQM